MSPWHSQSHKRKPTDPSHKKEARELCHGHGHGHGHTDAHAHAHAHAHTNFISHTEQRHLRNTPLQQWSRAPNTDQVWLICFA